MRIKMKGIKYIILFWTLIQVFAGLEAQEECRNLAINYSSLANSGDVRSRSNGVYDGEWLPYDLQAPAATEPYDYGKHINVSFTDDLDTVMAERIYIDYPTQMGKVELIDTVDGVAVAVLYPWEITPELAAEYNYNAGIPNVEDIWIFSTPQEDVECPTIDYQGISFRTGDNGILEYAWRYKLIEYYIVPDHIKDNKSALAGDVACIDIGELQTWAESTSEGINKAYNGGCDERIDTNGDIFEVIGGGIVDYSGGTVEGNRFTPTHDNWQLLFTGDLQKLDQGAFADFKIIEIR